MRRQPWGAFAIAAAILVVGLVALGVPAGVLIYAGLGLGCMVMMMTMMSGMHGMHGGKDDVDKPAEHSAHGREDQDRYPSDRR